MSRTIKFRAWNSATSTMHENVGIDPYASHHYVFDKDGPLVDMYGSSPTLMQFTGCQDCTGKDIYEGDIVENTSYESNPRGIVTWLPYGFVIVKDDTKSFFTLQDDWRVLGNVYEHKHLLNEVK